MVDGTRVDVDLSLHLKLGFSFIFCFAKSIFDKSQQYEAPARRERQPEVEGSFSRPAGTTLGPSSPDAFSLLRVPTLVSQGLAFQREGLPQAQGECGVLAISTHTVLAKRTNL